MTEPDPISAAFARPHLLGIETLSAAEISSLLDTADGYVAQRRRPDKKSSLLRGRTVINLFFANSTRPRTAFELAAKRPGADTSTMSVSTSTIHTGEARTD